MFSSCTTGCDKMCQMIGPVSIRVGLGQMNYEHHKKDIGTLPKVSIDRSSTPLKSERISLSTHPAIVMRTHCKSVTEVSCTTAILSSPSSKSVFRSGAHMISVLTERVSAWDGSLHWRGEAGLLPAGCLEWWRACLLANWTAARPSDWLSDWVARCLPRCPILIELKRRE